MANKSRGPRRVHISDATKQRWFRRGAAALSVAFPTVVGVGYCCPICARACPSYRAFSVEDVPPRKVGGKPLLLTCPDCNSKAGAKLDSHWGGLLDVESFIRGELSQPLTAQLLIDSIPMTVELTRVDKMVQLVGIKEASNPASVAAQLDILRKSASTPNMRVSFHKSRFNERSARISILRSGYLTGVAVTGYRHIRAWSRIRNVVWDPTKRDDDDLLHLVRHEDGHPLERRTLAVINEPAEMWSLYVAFGPWAVFIPFAADSALYSTERRSGRWDFSGTSYEWPTEPTFGIADDWEHGPAVDTTSAV